MHTECQSEQGRTMDMSEPGKEYNEVWVEGFCVGLEFEAASVFSSQ